MAGLLAAQIATVSIALLLPPRRMPAVQLAEIATALKGGPLPTVNGETLVRTRQSRSPIASGAGWITLQHLREDLARLLGAPVSDVDLQLYFAPPFAGASTFSPPGPPPDANRRFAGPPFGRQGPPDFGNPAGPWQRGQQLGPPPGAKQGVAKLPPGFPDIGNPPGPWERGPPPGPPPSRDQRPPWQDAGGPGFGPHVNGAFIAALRTGGAWTVIQPTPPRFLGAWERRVLLWFILSFAVVAPIGYLFARRLTAPLASFARAAERLGHDVRAPPVPLHGPTELKRASRALNSMQVRLQRHLEDRTAMIGAISHDLRTPLARLKFRVERVAPDVRNPMLSDIAQMETMLASVLTFIRNTSEPGLRERIDLRSIAECVVDDAALLGDDASLQHGERLLVDVDPGAIQRVLANLVDNAVKYGACARVKVRQDGDDAVVEVVDSGPGLPSDELARVFEPFYRSGTARTLNGEGVGLGLSIARSIARAHGGEVELHPGAPGLVAELRLPVVIPL